MNRLGTAVGTLDFIPNVRSSHLFEGVELRNAIVGAIAVLF